MAIMEQEDNKDLKVCCVEYSDILLGIIGYQQKKSVHNRNSGGELLTEVLQKNKTTR